NPTPEFANVYGVTNLATLDYNSLQLQFRRRLSSRLQALASYTWSHSIDISSNDFFPNLPGSKLDPKIDRASSDFDVRHNLSAAITYGLPRLNEDHLASKFLRDWSIDAIFRARTALPLNIISGIRLFNVFGSGRPDLVEGVPLYLNDPTVAG